MSKSFVHYQWFAGSFARPNISACPRLCGLCQQRQDSVRLLGYRGDKCLKQTRLCSARSQGLPKKLVQFSVRESQSWGQVQDTASFGRERLVFCSAVITRLWRCCEQKSHMSCHQFYVKTSTQGRKQDAVYMFNMLSDAEALFKLIGATKKVSSV